eukprot:g1777.t1
MVDARPEGTPEGTNIWRKLLAEAARKSKTPDKTLVVVGAEGVGKASLVRGLCSAARGDSAAVTDAAKPPVASPLSFEMFDATDLDDADDVDADEPAPKVGVWILRDTPAVPAHAGLLQLALGGNSGAAADGHDAGGDEAQSTAKPQAQAGTVSEAEGAAAASRLGHTAMVVVVDLSRPWEALAEAKHWLKLACAEAERALERTGASLGARDELRRRVRDAVNSYRTPEPAGGA